MEDKIHLGDCLEVMKQLEPESIDALITDPPYGYSFMGKDWDKSTPSVDIWKECIRVLKPGAFAMIMSAPRLDVQSEMVIKLQQAGFITSFSPIYWAYASGFPKSMNISKMVDKRLGNDTNNKPITYRKFEDITNNNFNRNDGKTESTKVLYEHIPTSEQAKSLDGSYAGFQPKPAVEVIIVAMKPLSEKTYVNQAMKNGKGITWMDNARIPYKNEIDSDATDRANSPNSSRWSGVSNGEKVFGKFKPNMVAYSSSRGRFPANLLVSDGVLDNGKINISTGGAQFNRKSSLYEGGWIAGKAIAPAEGYGDSGDFSRYFSLDEWWRVNFAELPKQQQKTFPFLIEPKADKGERNEGLEGFQLGEPPASARSKPAEGRANALGEPRANSHPTVKPISLMSYLITLTTREGDTVLDPFIGSGTTAIAARILSRHFIGIEKEPEYHKIAEGRLRDYMAQKKMYEINK